MTLKEKKRKLSEILGINLFDSKFKEVDSIIEDGEKSVENKEQVGEKNAEPTQAAEDEKSNAEKETAENSSEQTEWDDPTESEGEKESASESDAASDEEQKENVDESETENEETAIVESQEDTKTPEEELFEAKLEAKLLRAGIREDKLDAAIKLFKADYTIADIAIVDKWVKQYPEWKETKTKEQAKGFGMNVGEGETGETPEERRLRELGITK